MWTIAGHDIGLAGGPYMDDHGDPMVNVRCYDCAYRVDMSWCLWIDPDESGEPAPTGPALEAVVEHLRSSGVDVTDSDVDAASMLAAFSGEIEAALQMLSER